MSRTAVNVLRAASFLAAAAVVAAPPTGQAAASAATGVRNLTQEQVNKLPPRLGVTPRFGIVGTAIQWRGADLLVEPPGMGVPGHPADAGCVNYPDGWGCVYRWAVGNAGRQPTTGKGTVTISCEVAPASLPATTRQAWDQRLCGCMRKVFVDQVPPLPAGQIYGYQPSERTILSFISIPDPLPSCSDPSMPHAKVVVRVVPRPEEGPAVSNNDRVVRFCL